MTIVVMLNFLLFFTTYFHLFSGGYIFLQQGYLMVFFSMQVSIQCYRARIGCVNRTKPCSRGNKAFFSRTFLHFLFALFFNNHFTMILCSLCLSLVISFLLFMCTLAIASFILLSHVHDALLFLFSAGHLLAHKPIRFPGGKLFDFTELVLFTFSLSTVIMMLLTSFGTVEKNPGPPSTKSISVSGISILC